jgi:uncharacterized caspase-like protein
MRILFILFFSFTLITSPVKADEDSLTRFALVIGNQNYEVSPLRNSLNDASAISDMLTDLGFRVFNAEDADAKTMKAVINDFYDVARNHGSNNKLAVVYYAGHAIQINHANYLIPLNIEFDSEETFVSSLYNLSDLFRHMQNSPGLQNIVILDACRDNPFEGSFDSGVSQGLAPVKAPAGTLIAFATEPGGVASDGRGRNGVYTKHLLRYLNESIAVEEIFKKVRTGVAKDTKNRQIPWEHSSLLSDVYFSPPKNKNLPNIVVF